MKACSGTPPKQNQDFVKEHNRTPLISTKDNAGRPAEGPAEESGEAPPSERPLTSGTERDRRVHKEDIHKQSDHPYSRF